MKRTDSRNPDDRGRLGRFALTAAVLACGLAPANLLPGWAGRVVGALRSDRMSRADIERMERGYYEPLLDAGRRLGAPDEAKAIAARFEVERLAEVVSDLREYTLKPNLRTTQQGALWSTDTFGLRDREYAPEKPPHTVRVALVGDSIGAGWGVADGEAFEPRIEKRLDALSKAEGGPAVEILNFAVPGHSPGQRWENFRLKGWPLGIDLVLYEATMADTGWDERRLRVLLPRGIGWDSPLYHDTLVKLGARPGGMPEVYKDLLRPHRLEILAGVYARIVAECRARGVPAVWVLVPRVGRDAEADSVGKLAAIAREAGFDAIIDLSGSYDGAEPEDLAIAPNDHHPNADGHARLARRLEAALLPLPEWRRLVGRGGSAGPVSKIPMPEDQSRIVR